MRLIAHPFRLNSDGSVVTVKQGSDAARAQEIGALVATVRGERDAARAFGITDPAFGHVDTAEVQTGLALFGPPVSIDGIVVTYPTGTSERVEVTWSSEEAS